MANYIKKTTAYRLRTKVISKLMLFIKLTGGPFFQGQSFFKFGEFWVFFYNVHRISKLRVRVFLEQVKSVLLLEQGRIKPKVWAGSVYSPVKDVVSS